MGTVERSLPAAAGLGACAAAFLVGAPWQGALLAAGMYVAWPFVARPVGLAFTLVAPVVLAAGTPLPTIIAPEAFAWALVAALAVLPAFLSLHPTVPWKGFPVLAAGVPLLLATLLLFPWAPSSIASDIATRAQIVLLAVVAAVALSVDTRLRFPRRLRTLRKRRQGLSGLEEP